MNDMILSPLVLRTLGKSNRVKLLEQLSKIPGRKFSLNELSREAKVPLKTTQRAVKEFQDLGLVYVERIGATCAIYVNEKSSLYKDIGKMRLEDPHTASAKLFAKCVSKIGGVVACYLFGSTSTLKHKTSSDIDVAVIYDKKKITLNRLQKKIDCESPVIFALHATLIPLFFSVEEFNNPTLENKRLVQDIKQGEILWKQKKQ